MKYSSFEHFFTTLGNKQRVQILRLLASEGPKSVGSICETLEAEQSATSHNLRQLLVCHFVTVSKVGRERIYTLNEETVRPLLDQINNHVNRYCVKSCEHKTTKIKEKI